jgi:MFS family permease
MAPYFSQIFFQGSSQYLKYYLTFALGYLFRPLGGIFFGIISDKFGRKKTFQILVLLMSASTCFISLLTPQFAPHLSTALLVLCRVLQGLAVGGEFSNAVTFIHENNKDSTFHNSLIISGATLGNLFALAVMSLLSLALNKTEILAWGWRVPFLLGGVLGILCYKASGHMDESTEFTVHKQRLAKVPFGRPILEIFSTCRAAIILGTTLSLSISSLIVLFLYMPTHLSEVYGYSEKAVYNAMTLALLWSLLLAPVVGHYKFKLGKMRLLSAMVVLSLVILIPSFKLVPYRSTVALIGFLLIFETVLTALYVHIIPTLTSLFRVSVRNTGIAFCYNVGFALSSLIPVALSYLNKFRAGESQMVQGIIAIVLMAALLALYAFKKLVANTKA